MADEIDEVGAGPVRRRPWWFTSDFLGWLGTILCVVVLAVLAMVDLRTTETELPPVLYGSLTGFAAMFNPRLQKLVGRGE